MKTKFGALTPRSLESVVDVEHSKNLHRKGMT